MYLENLTGPDACVSLTGRRFAAGMDTLRLGGCLDAPEFVAVGGAQCPYSVSVTPRDGTIPAEPDWLD